LPLDVMKSVFGLYTKHFSSADDSEIEHSVLYIASATPTNALQRRWPQQSKARLSALAAQYQAELTAAAVRPTEPTVPPTTAPPPPSLVYLAFEGALNAEYTAEALRLLDETSMTSPVRAAFFVPSDPEVIVEMGPLLRQIYTAGHAVGLQLSGGWDTPEAAAAEFRAANDALRAVIFTKTRLAGIVGGAASVSAEAREALVAEGARLWDVTISTAGRTARQIRASLSGARGTSVLGFSLDAAMAETLPSILNTLDTGNYSLLTITTWDTPINTADELR
jgi:hypothetical protein